MYNTYILINILQILIFNKYFTNSHLIQKSIFTMTFSSIEYNFCVRTIMNKYLEHLPLGGGPKHSVYPRQWFYSLINGSVSN